MMPTPLPGISSASVLLTLGEIIDDAERRRVPGLSGEETRDIFVGWFRHSRLRIANSLTTADAEAVLPMASAWRIAAASGPNFPGVTRGDPAFGLIDAEFEIVLNGLHAARDALSGALRRLGQPEGVFVVLDTSVYVQHLDRLKDLLIAEDLGLRSESVRIVVPMVVIDELDALKEHKNNHVRGRALHTLGKLNELLVDGIGPAKLRDGNPWNEPPPHGVSYIEVLHDPPGHHRLPINDDEIIDRAVTLQYLAAGSHRLKFVTFDTGQNMRARAAGLDVVKLDRNEHQPPKADSAQTS